MDSWKKEGLRELGLTVKEYYTLSKKEKKEIDEALEVFGHGKVKLGKVL